MTAYDLAIDGTYFLWAAIVVVVVLLTVHLARTTPPPRWRCCVCSASFPGWSMLLAHESEQHELCYCGPGAHYPSCALRGTK